MYVRVLTGRYAGEVRDIRPDAAKQMLADGRAIDEDAEWPVNRQPEQPTAAAKPQRRRHG